jgi:peroxiredoxin
MSDEAPVGGPPRPSPQEAAFQRLARSLLTLGAALVVLIVVWMLLSSSSDRGAGILTIADAQAIARADGRPAPAFSMPALDGSGEINLADYEGKVVVLNVWASWCGPCRKEAAGLEANWRRFKDRGVQFLGVDYRDDPAAARAFQQEFEISYPSLEDPAGELAFDYDVPAIPATYIITADRHIAYRCRLPGRTPASRHTR